MSNIKHSKFSNTGIIFELLTRKIASDTLSNIESQAPKIIKKHFVNTELGKEYKLYHTALKNTNLSPTDADITVNSILESSKKLDRNKLKTEKYNLIKEIKSHYELNDFFSAKLSNYKGLASLYILMESINTSNNINPSQEIQNKITLINEITKSFECNSEINNEDAINEFKKYDKDLRVLTYKILLEKFNSKYSGLNQNQKEILREIITSIDSTVQIKEFYNRKTKEIKKYLEKLNRTTTDKAINIKINEVSNMLVELSKTDKVNDDKLVNLLQYYELIEELKKANGKA